MLGAPVSLHWPGKLAPHLPAAALPPGNLPVHAGAEELSLGLESDGTISKNAFPNCSSPFAVTRSLECQH